jgi:glycosyltransferase involved in cell wall biosynthesis
MAGGAPVICTNAGGLPEIVIPGENGYMSNVGDVEDMARNAITILKDHATYEHFRTGALRQA